MHRTPLLNDLDAYQANGLMLPEETESLSKLLNFINTNPHCFERFNKGHITSSIWIVNHDGSEALLTHHKKLNFWLQLGGHNDGDNDCRAVALKEAEEESGILGLEFITTNIFDIDVHAIPSSCEYHYDMRYLLRAPKDAQFIVSEESHNLAWINREKIGNYSTERSVLRMAEKFERYFL